MSKERRSNVAASGSAQARGFMQQLYRDTRNAKMRFAWLKMSGTQALIDEIARACPETFRVHLFGRVAPTKYAELFRSSRNFTDSVELELRWEIMVMVRNSTKLRAFFESRRLFDRSLLLGNFSKAREVLSQIE